MADNRTFLQLAHDRYSVRKFSDKLVENDKLDKIVEAGWIAPTAKNNQAFKVYIITSEEGVAAMNEASPCIYGARTVIAICADYDHACSVQQRENYNFCETDCAIVLTHMMLEAEEQGVGSCWVGCFDPKLAGEWLGLPESQEVMSLMPIGYPAEDCGPADRHEIYRSLEELVEYR